MHIPVVDIFAGPGGLGEGFSGYVAPNKSHPFRITISAEMEENAWRTLRLRAFFRQFRSGHVPDSYYDYVAGRRKEPYTFRTERQWIAACEEARQLKLGNPADDRVLRERIAATTSKDEPWILIGGPPCQAYSLVGRARNRGILGYRAEDDERYRLYQHYRKLVAEFAPAAFVMENVKGLLSAEADGNSVFEEIAKSLQRPGGSKGPRYRLVPLIKPRAGLEAGVKDPRDFIIRAETLGVPQARHRVILLGIRDDYSIGEGKFLSPREWRCTVSEAIGALPPLRSGMRIDGKEAHIEDWAKTAAHLLRDTAEKVNDDQSVRRRLRQLATEASTLGDPTRGALRQQLTPGCGLVPEHLASWLLDPRLDTLLNHETRSHQAEDLQRYAYVSAFGEVHGRSPRGAAEFPEALHPKHKNWKSGKFVDRFKVQLSSEPSLTVTSHLKKDGHYFIHPDPAQMRSLTVREAARLQTFPDNYFFEGAQGWQYGQVGNAVPPWMARQIAGIVYSYLRV
ncbi:DNA (cytosine-5-)-methyltransferase [Pseudoxanthomonas sp.]|jgi:DNA (cytosine-5)-methyltransferase 1|uniref:DNA cytosine methyltransferase n=1 Tax=Pseudoxanthomonas sp. TaxID=1871049 RepID=UPI002E15349E|nr:DNA (cytosine-5-)-methyltransferase [Pseudoxanthomonas sp.]